MGNVATAELPLLTSIRKTEPETKRFVPRSVRLEGKLVSEFSSPLFSVWKLRLRVRPEVDR